MDKFDCVVIGAGLGGLGAAADLAKRGLKPLVIERGNVPGGTASSFVRGRFEFETTLHLWPEFLMAPIVKGALGVDEKMIDLPRVATYAYKAPDGTVVNYEVPLTEDGLRKKLKEVMPGCEKDIDTLLDLSVEMLTAAFPPADGVKLSPEEFAKKFPHFEEFSQLTVAQAFEKLWTPKVLQDFFYYVWFWEGPDIEDEMFIRFAAVFDMLYMNVTQYPVNRSHGITAALEDIIRKNGGDIWFNTSVTKVNVEDGKVTGIETDHGDRISTDIVISDVSPKALYGELVSDRSQVKDYTIQLHNSLKENICVCLVYMGLDAPMEEIGLKTFHIFATEERDQRIVQKACYRPDGPYAIDGICYNAGIPDWTPEGTCALNFMIPMHGEALEGMTQKEYFEFKERIAERSIRSFEELLGIDLRSHIEELEVATPATIARYNGHRNGALGYQQYALNMEAFTNSLYEQENYIDGLYLVGQFLHPFGYDNVNHGYAMGDKIAKKIKGEQ